MKELLKVKQLDVGYQEEIVIEGLDFEINQGEVLVILGRSGCGKSTILKTLIGLIPPLSGQVLLDQQPIDYRSEKSVSSLYKRIGVLYQNSALLNSFNLYDNIALPIRMHYPDLPEEIEQEMVFARLSQVGLDNSSEKFPSELSGGMKKRAAVARAMILDPDIIFCDEPSAGLDPITALDLDRLILDLCNNFNIAFVVVTHELRSIEAIATRALVLNEGRMHFYGEYRQLFELNDSFINYFFLKGDNNDNQRAKG